MGRVNVYRVVVGLLLIAVWGMARPAAARDLYPLSGAGNISSHNVAHTRSAPSNDQGTPLLKLDDFIANKLAPGNALYVIPTVGIGTHSSAPAILFQGHF